MSQAIVKPDTVRLWGLRPLLFISKARHCYQIFDLDAYSYFIEFHWWKSSEKRFSTSGTSVSCSRLRSSVDRLIRPRRMPHVHMCPPGLFCFASCFVIWLLWFRTLSRSNRTNSSGCELRTPFNHQHRSWKISSISTSVRIIVTEVCKQLSLNCRQFSLNCLLRMGILRRLLRHVREFFNSQSPGTLVEELTQRFDVHPDENLEERFPHNWIKILESRIRRAARVTVDLYKGGVLVDNDTFSIPHRREGVRRAEKFVDEIKTFGRW